jgi:hypothetical protein
MDVPEPSTVTRTADEFSEERGRDTGRFRYGRALAFSCIAFAAALVISM